MATQNRRGYGNPYGSADLGSGVRTTTGGSYRNPRLGIEDYTAWSKMNVQAPGIKEKGKIKFDGFDVFGDEIDTFTGGRTFNSEFFNVLTNNFKNGELSEYQKLFENGNTETQNGVQAHVNGWADDFKKLQNYMTKWTDDQVYDPNVSDTRLPSAEIDGYSDMTYAFFVEDTSKNPKDWTAKTIVNSNGVPHRVLEKTSTGQQFSITAMTEERMSKDFNVKADLAGDVQASILKDGTAQGYKGVKPSYNTDNTSITVNLPDGTTVQTNKNSEKYIRQGWYNDTDQYATIFADKKYASQYDATYKSAWHQLAQRFKNGSFTPQHKEDENGNVISSLKNEMLQKYDIDDISKIGEIDISNEDRIKLLRDEAQEEFKILNGSVGYDRGEDGRALDKRVVQYNTDNIIKPRTDDSGDGSGFSYENFATDFYGSLNKAVIGNVKGEKTAGGQEPFENFLQAYGVPIAGAENSVQSIRYVGKKGDVLDPNKIATDLSRLGTLNITWAKEGFNEKGKKIVGAMEIPYDLTDKDGIRKLVNHMSAFSPELKGTSTDAKRRRNAIIEGYEKAIQEVTN